MIYTRYVIYPHDSIYEAFVLRPEGEGKLLVMEAYRDLVCPTCGKVDERVRSPEAFGLRSSSSRNARCCNPQRISIS